MSVIAPEELLLCPAIETLDMVIKISAGTRLRCPRLAGTVSQVWPLAPATGRGKEDRETYQIHIII